MANIEKNRKLMVENMKKVREILKESKSESDISNILFDISALVDSLDNEQLQNLPNLDDRDSKLLRRSVDGMMKSLKPIKHLIDTSKLSK